MTLWFPLFISINTTLSVPGSAGLESFGSSSVFLLLCAAGSALMGRLCEYHKGLRLRLQHTNVSLWLLEAQASYFCKNHPPTRSKKCSPFCICGRKCKWVNIILPKYQCSSCNRTRYGCKTRRQTLCFFPFFHQLTGSAELLASLQVFIKMKYKSDQLTQRGCNECEGGAEREQNNERWGKYNYKL